jgi:DNA-binding response OmpR family regulator
MRILLVEDNQRLSEAVSESLSKAGFEVDPVAAGGDALAALGSQPYDAVVLDLGLPDVDGTDVLRQLREKKNTLPVLILTARDSLSDKISGLNLGADDYMVKPFETDELVARVHALLRRPAQALDAVLTLGSLSFDSIGRQAKAAGQGLDLSRRETDLLEQLLRNAGKIVTKKTIEMRLYSYEERGSVNSVEVLVHRLRKKLQAQAPGIEIHTLRGIGYMIAETGNAQAAH